MLPKRASRPWSDAAEAVGPAESRKIHDNCLGAQAGEETSEDNAGGRRVRRGIFATELVAWRAVQLLFGRCFANVITRLVFPLFPRTLLCLLFHVLPVSHTPTQRKRPPLVSLSASRTTPAVFYI